jgi:hypothetical protein
LIQRIFEDCKVIRLFYIWKWLFIS